MPLGRGSLVGVRPIWDCIGLTGGTEGMLREGTEKPIDDAVDGGEGYACEEDGAYVGEVTVTLT